MYLYRLQPLFFLVVTLLSTIALLCYCGPDNNVGCIWEKLPSNSRTKTDIVSDFAMVALCKNISSTASEARVGDTYFWHDERLENSKKVSKSMEHGSEMPYLMKVSTYVLCRGYSMPIILINIKDRDLENAINLVTLWAGTGRSFPQSVLGLGLLPRPW